MSCRQCSNHQWEITECRNGVARLARVAVRTERRMDVAAVNRLKGRLREYQDNLARHQQAEHAAA